MPVAAQGAVGSGAIKSAGIYSAGNAVEAVQPLETSVVMYYMFAAANTAAAADTELSTADSAAASPSTALVDAPSDAAEKYSAERSADIPAAAAATRSDT